MNDTAQSTIPACQTWSKPVLQKYNLAGLSKSDVLKAGSVSALRVLSMAKSRQNIIR